MKNGLLRNHKMVLGSAPAPLFQPPAPSTPTTHDHACSSCPVHLPLAKRWGSFSLDAGRTWWCAAHKPEQRP